MDVERAQANAPGTANAMLKRGNIALEDGDFAAADGFFEQALNTDPECAEAYLGKLLSQVKARRLDDLKNREFPFTGNPYFQKALRFASPDLKTKLQNAVAAYENRLETEKKDALYQKAKEAFASAKTEADYVAAQKLFKNLSGHRDADEMAGKCETGQKECIYKIAAQRLRSASDPEDFLHAAEQFKRVSGFKDADELAQKCETERKEHIYNTAVNKLNSNNSLQITEAEELFKKIPGFKDADELAQKCEAKREEAVKKEKHRNKIVAIIAAALVVCVTFVIVLTTVIIPSVKYNSAVKLMEAGKYEEAISAFTAMNGYKDSADKITECQYNAAVKLMDEGKYEEAISAFKATDGYKDSADKITECQNASAYDAAVMLMDEGKYEEAISAFNAMDGYKDSADKIAECQYNAAVKLMDEGKYEEAISAFTAMNGYKDSGELLKEIYKKQLVAVKVGDTVRFGSYEQDNNTSNGKEEIEWRVLAKEGNKILVISKYALDCQQYHTSRTEVTWETCSLRKWLNGAFLSAAFSSEEQNRIISSTVTADKNPSYSTSPGNNTTDKVFLLSITEVKKYFISDEERKCAPTEYAIARSAYTDSVNCWWWLRSPGVNSIHAACVDRGGSVFDDGLFVSNVYVAVRPALWIDLGS